MSRKNEITKFQFIELRKLELMEGYIMIGFSIMMWFCSALLIFVSFSLLKGNYSSVHPEGRGLRSNHHILAEYQEAPVTGL